MKPLCVHLNYLMPNAPDNLHMHSVDNSGYLYSFEGPRGSLELLHPCPECPSMTKFQALFVEDAVFDKYRKAFFLNSANRPGAGGDQWLLGTLDVSADALFEEGHSEIAALLRYGSDIIRRRSACYGSLYLPLACTSECAWTVWRQAVSQEGYYLSVEELHFFASLKHCCVRTFLYDASAPQEPAFEELRINVPPLISHTTEAKVSYMQKLSLARQPFS